MFTSTSSILVPFLGKVLTLIITIIVLIITYIKWRHQYWQRRNIPCIPPKVPFGNLENPSRRRRPIGNIVKDIYDEMKKQHHKYCGVYFFASPIFLPIDLDCLKNIMTKDFNHFTDRGMYYNEKSDPISAHLFAIGGNKWRNLRTKLTPTFTSGKMKMMFPSIVECVSLLFDTMTMQTNPIDIKELLGRFTTDTIGSCAFGLDCNTIKEDDSPFRVYGKRVFESNKARTFKMTFVTNFPQIGRLLGIRQVSSEISDFFTQIVKDTVAYREEHQVTRRDFMQLLIDLKNEGNSLTIEEVVAQAFIFFLAGFETSSTTMTFALYELAKNQDIQDRLRNEIQQVLAKHHGEITYDAINEMKYLSQVLDESLRKHPPVPFVTRTCVQDYQLPDADGVTIEKGRRVIVPILAIHRDPEYYPEPEKFDPDRFSDEMKRTRHSYAHIPFGEGPRICIGMRFGAMQSKVGLAALLNKYRFTINSKTKEPLKMSLNAFISTAEGGIWLDSHKI